MTINLGRRLLHDPKSRNFAYPKAAPEKSLSVRHHLYAPHVDQFYLGGCVGFSGANALNTAYAYRSRKQFNRQTFGNPQSYLDNNDGIKNYSESTKRDPFPGEYPPTDEGSSAIGLMKWWQELGVITGYDWTFTFDGFLAALQRQPLLMGTWWYDDMMSTDSHGVVHSELRGGRGGHEYLANALFWPSDPKKRLVGFEQSWGEHPAGFRARFYMPWDLVEHLILDQGDVCVPRFL